MLWGLSPHSLRVIQGTARLCRLVSPVPGTRVRLVLPLPGTRVRPRFREPGSASIRRFREKGFAQGSANQGPPWFAGSGNQGSGNPAFREPGFGASFREPKVPRTRVWARFREQWVLASFWVPGRQGSGTLGCRTMASSNQSLDCAKVLESPEHQFWNILETQSLANQGSGKVLATLGSDKVPGNTAAADPEFGHTPWIMP